ncbi:MAG: hypothetical protein K1X89_18120 [Myxococcaceae bacterium]|nr:hypothetical protein [Myxococcaceae bacterium]
MTRTLPRFPRFLTLVALAALASACAAGGGSSQTSQLPVRVYAPLGTKVTLKVNGGNDLEVTVVNSTGGAPNPYDLAKASFSTPLADGAAYEVTIASKPADQTCQVYAGKSGTMPVAEGIVRVGCEYTAESVARSTDDKTVGTYFDTGAVAVGGGSSAVASTGTPYGEGRFVAFVSSAKIAGASGAHRQVFLRDRFVGETYLVSSTSAGVEGDGDSDAPAISADGATIAFESTAKNLVTGDTNDAKDVFLWDYHSVFQPGVTRVSVADDGSQFAGASGLPSLNGDGKVVVFETRQSNVTTNGDGGGAVIRRDLVAKATTLLSKDASGKALDSFSPMVSEDGKRIVFYSFWPLVAGDANGLWDIFLYDVTSSSLKRVSLTSTGGERNQGTESSSRSVAPAISGDGRWVAFATTATNMVPGDTNDLQDVFVVDTQTGAVTRASVSTSGAQGDRDSPIGQGERPSLSFDGTWVGFGSTANNLGVTTSTTGLGNAFLHNNVTGETRALTSNTTCCSVGRVALSREAGYAVFGSSASLDPRFAGSGQFAAFTSVTRAFWWIVE